MAAANRTWGEERIADELFVKVGIQVSPRTVRRYMPSRPPREKAGKGTQEWSTFVRNHAQAILATDFFVVVTATFRVLYVFVVLDVGTRRLCHWNVTEHPTADWTAQQFRMVVPDDQTHRFVIHDRDTIYSEGVDRTLAAMGLEGLKTPVHVPQGNAFCERLIGTIRRECLDFMIPLTERHARAILSEWICHYNRGRPHSCLGPGLPDPPPDRIVAPTGHTLPRNHRVDATSILGGLHHEYRLEVAA
jgi:transposase InsO family protein